MQGLLNLISEAGSGEKALNRLIYEDQWMCRSSTGRFSRKQPLKLMKLVVIEWPLSAISGHSNSADVLIHSDTNPLYSTAITRIVVSPTFSAQWAVTGPTHRG